MWELGLMAFFGLSGFGLLIVCAAKADEITHRMRRDDEAAGRSSQAAQVRADE